MVELLRGTPWHGPTNSIPIMAKVPWVLVSEPQKGINNTESARLRNESILSMNHLPFLKTVALRRWGRGPVRGRLALR